MLHQALENAIRNYNRVVKGFLDIANMQRHFAHLLLRQLCGHKVRLLLQFLRIVLLVHCGNRLLVVRKQTFVLQRRIQLIVLVAHVDIARIQRINGELRMIVGAPHKNLIIDGHRSRRLWTSRNQLNRLVEQRLENERKERLITGHRTHATVADTQHARHVACTSDSHHSMTRLQTTMNAINLLLACQTSSLVFAVHCHTFILVLVLLILVFLILLGLLFFVSSGCRDRSVAIRALTIDNISIDNIAIGCYRYSVVLAILVTGRHTVIIVIIVVIIIILIVVAVVFAVGLIKLLPCLARQRSLIFEFSLPLFVLIREIPWLWMKVWMILEILIVLAKHIKIRPIESSVG
mmetsp:Transcript_44826/g.74253  ORF Transcript_44826/g.74253 Transcript_44826/m.74253 type:complete len:349 (-) Transcript_44826:609-1655(-)